MHLNLKVVPEGTVLIPVVFCCLVGWVFVLFGGGCLFWFGLEGTSLVCF